MKNKIIDSLRAQFVGHGHYKISIESDGKRMQNGTQINYYDASQPGFVATKTRFKMSSNSSLKSIVNKRDLSISLLTAVNYTLSTRDKV